MARTRKLRLKGGQIVGTKRKADISSEELRGEEDIKKQKTDVDPILSAAETIISLGVPPKIPINPCFDTVNASYMGYHLRADTLHDFGSVIATPKVLDNLHGIAIPAPTSEKDVVQYFKSNYPAFENTFRNDNIINFSLAERTSLFSQQGVEPIFKPFTNISNKEIGVLQDAGVKLYKLMNATNLITFGSILDQAGKPIEEAFLFNAGSESLTFPACVFGFNREKVKEITISKFNGKSVTCNFSSSIFGTGGSDGPIQLNQRQGDFRSIAEVKAIPEGNKRMKGIIGKALGDALLVASLMPNVGGIKNPLCPPLPGKINSLKSGEERTIKRVIFNTGDQLAHIRAYAFGIPTVYSSSLSGIRNFEYIPGIDSELTPEQLNKYYSDLSEKMITDIETAYTDLITHLNTLIVSNKFIIQKSLKSGLPLIPDNEYNKEYTAKIISLLIKNISKIKDIVNIYCKSKITDKPSEEGYRSLLVDAGRLTPSSTSTISRNGRDVLSILNILKPANDISDKIPKGNYTFYIAELYQLIGKKLPLPERLTKIFTMFGDEMPVQDDVSRSRRGGANKNLEVFGTVFTGPTLKMPDIKIPEVDTEFLNESYLVKASKMTSKEIVEAYETYKYNPDSILDEMLLESLYNELKTIIDVPKMTNVEVDKTVHTQASLKFNEFACRFNSSIVGEETDLGKLLLKYADEFKKLSVPQAESIAPGSSPVRTRDLDRKAGLLPFQPQRQLVFAGAAGQRVEREKFSIDSTKSFVKTGGAANSMVK